MKASKAKQLDFEVDKLTNCIENPVSGEVFSTVVARLTAKDSRQIKKADWQFDWHEELKDKTKEVYKLVTEVNPGVIQGLICIEDKKTIFICT